MNTTAFPPFQFSHGFWPFSACSLKPTDFPIVHPAFIHTQYSNYPAPCGTQGSNGGFRTKSDSFTIDAILSRDRVDDIQRSPETKHFEYHLTEQCNTTYKDSPLTSRRHARLHDSSHPYLSPSNKRHTGTCTTTTKRSLENLKGKFDYNIIVLNKCNSFSANVNVTISRSVK